MRIINFADGFTSSSEPTVDSPASSVSVTPTGDLASTNVQAALVELQGDIDAAEAVSAAHLADVANPHAVTKTQVGLSNVTNDAQIPLAQKGAVSGVAELDAGGKVPTAQLPDSVVGSVEYQSTWDASTNTPALGAVPEKGHYYVVSVAGATSLSGIADWAVGDWAISNGTAWEKVDNTESVVSVSGRTGVITLTSADVGLANVDNTSDATKNAAAVQLTNKDYQGGTASDTSRITVPKNTFTNLDALTRKEATIVYDTTSGSLMVDNGVDLVAVGSGAGSGEKNYIENPSCATSTDGWANSALISASRTTTAALLPREHTTGTALRMIASAGVTSTADYVYYDFTLDDVDLSKKLKIQWSQTTEGGYAAGDYAVIITSQADRTTALHTPVTTAIPAMTGVFTTSFDAGTTATLSLVIRATTDVATSVGLIISDVVVGPGTSLQGAVVSAWQSYTPTTTNFATASAANRIGRWRRVGDTMHIRIRAEANGVGTGTFDFSLPSGYTIDTSKIVSSGTYGQLGTAGGFDFGTAFYSGNVCYASTTTVNITDGDGSGAGADFWKTGVPFAWNNTDIITMDFMVPIAEWSGSGTVNLAQNDVEYASNSSSTDAADTTSFVYGPAGSTGVIATTALTAARLKRVNFQTAIQDSDQLTLQIQISGSGPWVDAISLNSNAGVEGSYQEQNTASYGMGLQRASSTAVDVKFGTYSQATGATYGAAGGAWNTQPTSGTRWRVKKSSGGAAVGFGNVAQSSAGLVKSAGQLLGTNTNDSAATGYVGEYLNQTRLRSAASALVDNTAANVTATALTLTAGDWDISGYVGLTGAVTVVSADFAIGTTSATVPAADTLGVPTTGQCRIATPTGSTASVDHVISFPSVRATIAATTTYYLVARVDWSAGAPSVYGSIQARRVR